MSGAGPIEDAESLRASLVELGHLREGERLELLSGGVSGIVALAHHEPEPFVAKCARPRLDVPEDWFADPVRTLREARILEHLGGALGPVAVPRVRFLEQERNLVGLQAFVPVPPTWQQRLLGGEAERTVARKVAAAIASLHRLPAPDGLDRAEGAALFDQLRLDPYYRTVKREHPDLAESLDGLITACEQPAPCSLVHGDLSPKNVLVAPDGLVLVDFEVICHGDPAFDVGMLLGHLVLKTIYFGDAPAAAAIAGLITAFWSAYRSEGGAAAEDRVVGQVGGILLARVLGKSRVHYLDQAGEQRALRVARQLVRGTHSVDELPALLKENPA